MMIINDKSLTRTVVLSYILDYTKIVVPSIFFYPPLMAPADEKQLYSVRNMAMSICGAH